MLHRRRTVLALLVAVPLALAASASRAQERALEVRVGDDAFLPLPRQPRIFGSEDEAIATVTVLPDGRARVHGVAPGRTRLVGRDFAELPMIFPVVVTAR